MKKIINCCELCAENCLGCFYADVCDVYNDNGGDFIPQVVVDVDVASMALCQGRHEIPEAADGSIFDNELDPLAVDELEEDARCKLEGLEIKSLNLYVTGLTVALIACLNACRSLGIAVTLYHFDRASGTYYPQTVR